MKSQHFHNPEPQTQNVAINAIQEHFVLSPQPKKAIQEMMETIDRLRGIYERETEALAQSDTTGFIAMQDEKLLAARDYQDGINQIIKRKDEMRQTDPDIRSKLEEMQSEFSTLAARNLKALERMQRCMERVGQTIRKAATDAARQERSFSYTANGRIAADEAKTVSTGSISETA